MARPVPWRSWKEWDEVGSWLMSGDTALERQGLERVACWRVLRHLPLAVETTASLVEAMHMQRSRTADGSSSSSTYISDYTLRLRIALALIKLVNGVADSQQRGRVALSVSMLAGSVGLPRLVVDIRHEATHSELPSLQVLQLGSKQTLEWLSTSYWGAQAVQLERARLRLAGPMSSVLECYQGALVGVGTAEVAGSEEDEEGPGPAQRQRMAAQAQAQALAAARVRSKELVSVLRSQLPGAWTQYLADIVLDSSCVDPPQPLGEGEGSSQQQQQQQQQQEKAWAEAVSALLQGYHSLGPLLLLGAVERLVHSSALPPPPGPDSDYTTARPRAWTGGAAGGEEARRPVWLRWALNLLPSGQQEPSGAAKPEKKKQSAFGAALSSSALKKQQQQQLQQDGIDGLRAQVGPISRAQLLQLLELLQGAPANAGPEVAQLLRLVCSLLPASGGPKGPKRKRQPEEEGQAGAKDRAALLLKLASLAPALAAEGVQERRSVGEAAAAGPLPGSVVEAVQGEGTAAAQGVEAAKQLQAALLERLRKRARVTEAPKTDPLPPPRVEETGRVAQESTREPDGGATSGAARGKKRWRLVKGPWSSCALGCLPCAFSPAGRPCKLDSPAAAAVGTPLVGGAAVGATAALQLPQQPVLPPQAAPEPSTSTGSPPLPVEEGDGPEDYFSQFQGRDQDGDEEGLGGAGEGQHCEAGEAGEAGPAASQPCSGPHWGTGDLLRIVGQVKVLV